MHVVHWQNADVYLCTARVVLRGVVIAGHRKGVQRGAFIVETERRSKQLTGDYLKLERQASGVCDPVAYLIALSVHVCAIHSEHVNAHFVVLRKRASIYGRVKNRTGVIDIQYIDLHENGI